MTSAENLPGNFERLLLPDILALLSESRATGQLSVVSSGATRDLHFVDGDLRAVRSDQEEERLGSWLVAHHLLSEARKQGILLIQQGHNGPPLGRILVAKGLIGTDPLEEQIEKLSLTILQRATSQQRRDLGFRRGAHDRQLDTLPRKPTQHLVLLAARAIQDADLKRQVLGRLDQVVSRTTAPGAAARMFDLTVPESIILDALSQPMAFNRLRSEARLSDDVFFSAAYNLRVVRLIHLATRSEETEPARTATTALRSPGSDARHHRLDTVDIRKILDEVDHLAETGEVYAAVKRLRHLCDIDPQPRYLIRLARLMFLRPQWAGRALEALRRASEIDPTNADAWVAVADYWNSQDDSDRERRALEQALIARPDNSESIDRYVALVGEEQFEAFLEKVFRLRRPGATLPPARVH